MAEGKLRIADTKLRAKEEEVAHVEADLNKCMERLASAKQRRQDLQDDAIGTKKRMTAANGLIDGLSGEQERWTAQSIEFKDLTRRLVGDCALACALIAYCGPFNAEFRQLLLGTQFPRACRACAIPVTESLAINNFLTDEEEVTDWALQGLPVDDHSVQNGIIIARSEKYPLLIDPQGQGPSVTGHGEGVHGPG